MRIQIILIALAMSVSAYAQTNEQMAEKIKADKAYIYGDGYGNTHAQADNNAVAELISKISMTLTNEFSQVEKEVNANGELTSTSAVQIIVNSYAQATLTNTQNIIIKEAPDAHVLRYVARSELDKIFSHRREKVMDMIRCAQRAEERQKIDDALRYYYWSFTMLKSLQYPNAATYDDHGEKRLLMVWIPEQINAILDKLTARITDAKGNKATLYFTYDGKPVQSLDFTFYNGVDWTMLNSAKNGIAEIELRPGVDARSLKIRYEYEYAGETQIDPEVQSVARIFKGTFFGKSEVALAGQSGSIKASNAASKEQAANAKTATGLHLKTVKDDKLYQKAIATIIDGVGKQRYDNIQTMFSDEGWDMMNRLLHYGKARLLGKQEYAFYDIGDGRVVCRSLAMTFSFPNNNKTFTEDVTFTFNADKQIECVAFGLGAEAKHDIFDKGDRAGWNDTSKLVIATFLENYKTAFALKRLDYIKSIFDDNAVIITGHVVRKSTNENQPYLNNEIVRYNRQTKQQYIRNLERCFASNQFVNIRFTDNEVKMAGKGGEVFGIQIHQDYYSSTYGDTGYLFLLVDVNNPEQPIIKVRTWQPEKDPELGLYDIGHF